MSARRTKKSYAGEKKAREASGAHRPLTVGPSRHKKDHPPVSAHELEELKLVFRLTDENGDGSITSHELKHMLQHKLGIEVDDDMVGDLMSSAAGHDEGLISEEAFITWFLKLQTLSASENRSSDLTTDLRAAFRLFDKDDNGFITMDELQRAMELIDERMSQDELSSLINMADVDKNGKIDYQEFLQMLL